MATTARRRHWTYRSGRDYEVGVNELPDGRWLASIGLRQVYDPHQTSLRQEVFDSVKDALAWVGYPVDLVSIPPELAEESR